jgi:hypothetical protein
MVHNLNGRSHLTFPHNCCTKKKWEVEDLHGFLGFQYNYQGPILCLSLKRFWTWSHAHEVYHFLDGFFGYHQIMIAPKDRYKNIFITNWGAFV